MILQLSFVRNNHLHHIPIRDDYAYANLVTLFLLPNIKCSVWFFLPHFKHNSDTCVF